MSSVAPDQRNNEAPQAAMISPISGLLPGNTWNPIKPHPKPKVHKRTRKIVQPMLCSPDGKVLHTTVNLWCVMTRGQRCRIIRMKSVEAGMPDRPLRGRASAISATKPPLPRWKPRGGGEATIDSLWYSQRVCHDVANGGV